MTTDLFSACKSTLDLYYNKSIILICKVYNRILVYYTVYSLEYRESLPVLLLGTDISNKESAGTIHEFAPTACIKLNITFLKNAQNFFSNSILVQFFELYFTNTATAIYF